MSIVFKKNRLLLANALIYLICGLSLFFYLIIKEMKLTVRDSMEPISDSKPEIYYSVFLKIIIGFNIISGVFRLLGSIFILIFIKMLNKMKKCKIVKFVIDSTIRTFK